MTEDLNAYLARIRACTLCAADMPNEPNPVLRAAPTARILVASQAPGNLADRSGVPFSDPSGVRLRAWMGVTEEEFYDETRIAIAPMGFCFPGYDRHGGDLAPMKRCAREWRAGLIARLPDLQVILLVGGHAQDWHLGSRNRRNLTETVANWRNYVSDHVFTTPHPSWRNNGWLKRNPWFEADVLPVLQASVRRCLQP